MIQIPLIQYPNQELQIILEEQNCTIKFYQRSGYCYMDLSLDNTVIKRGQLAIPGAPILANPTREFKGNFYIIDTVNRADAQELPNYEEFSTRYVLLYVTEEELNELETEIN